MHEGHPSTLIRDSVLSALEGCPRHTAKAAMEDGDGSLRSVMSALDQVYGGTTTYTTLLNKLNSVQQGYDENCQRLLRMCIANTGQAPGVPCLYVSQRRLRTSDQRSLFQWSET